MDLLGNEPQKQQKTNGQKIVLMLLITLIILSILVLILIFALKGNKTKTLALVIDNNNVPITQSMLISNENGVNYISLKEISSFIGYNYLRGGYGEYEEKKTKCYLENENQIIGFETNSNKIYKTIQNSKTDYEYYNLKNKIIQSNDILYIALEDLIVGCNVSYKFSEEEYKIIVDTPENLAKKYETDFEGKGLKIDDDVTNKKAIPYNMYVVSNENGKLGVVDATTNTIIGQKYSTINYDEFSQRFVVSNNNKYGIISKEGKIIVELKYEDIHIINYSPLIYEVELNKKVGVIDEKGNIIVNIEFDKLGCYENTSLREPVLIIKDLNESKEYLVVCNEGKYGLVDMKTGETILSCETEKIYGKKDKSGKIQYYVQQQQTEIELNKYIEYINTTTVIAN